MFSFDWIGEVAQTIAITYLIRNYPGLLLLIGAAGLAIVIAWKHGQKASEWRFNPRQVFGFGLMAALFSLIAMGAYLTLWWEP